MFFSLLRSTYSFIDLKVPLVAIFLEVFLVKVFSLKMFFFFEKLRLSASPESTTSGTSDSSILNMIFLDFKKCFLNFAKISNLVRNIFKTKNTSQITIERYLYFLDT